MDNCPYYATYTNMYTTRHTEKGSLNRLTVYKKPHNLFTLFLKIYKVLKLKYLRTINFLKKAVMQ